jgi:hypothetical protein
VDGVSRRPLWWLAWLAAAAVLTRALMSVIGYFAGEPSPSDVLLMTILVIGVAAGTVAFLIGIVWLQHAGVRRVARLHPQAYVRTVASASAQNYILLVDGDRFALLSFYRGRAAQSWPRDDIRSVTVAPVQVVQWNRPRPVMRPGIAIRFAHGGDPLQLVFLTRYVMALSKKTADAAAVKRALTSSEAERTA